MYFWKSNNTHMVQNSMSVKMLHSLLCTREEFNLRDLLLVNFFYIHVFCTFSNWLFYCFLILILFCYHSHVMNNFCVDCLYHFLCLFVSEVLKFTSWTYQSLCLCAILCILFNNLVCLNILIIGHLEKSFQW